MQAQAAQQWAGAFPAFWGRFATRFPRGESRRRMAECARGLLAELERMNGRGVAETAGDDNDRRIAQLDVAVGKN